MSGSRSAGPKAPRAQAGPRSKPSALLAAWARLVAAVTVVILGVFPGLVLDLVSLPALRVAVSFMLLAVGGVVAIEALRGHATVGRYRIVTAIVGAVGAALWSIWTVGETLFWLART
jgi:riboflavin transporter FmnP